MNTRFTRRYEQKIDHKGRTCLPSYFRKQLTAEERLYLHQEKNPSFLTLLPEQNLQDKWSNILSPLNTSYNLEETIQQLEKIGNIYEIKIDEHGRINLCRQTIDNRVYFIGAGEYIILYLGSKDSYEQYLKIKQ